MVPVPTHEKALKDGFENWTEDYPFVLYAALYWLDHIRGEVASVIQWVNLNI
jgi:hypothetical protein